MYTREQQRRCSVFLQAAHRGHLGRREFRRELWAKLRKDAAVLLTKAAVAKLEIIAAGAVCRVIWHMKFSAAVLKLQSCCRGWRTRNSNEYSRRRRIKSKIIRRLQNDSAITKLQRKIRAFKVQKAIALGLDLPDETPPHSPPPPDPDSLPYSAPQAASVSPARRLWPNVPLTPPLSREDRARNAEHMLSMQRLQKEDTMLVSRPADAAFAQAVLLQLQRALFPHHVKSLSPQPEDKISAQLAAAAAAYDDLKMHIPYGEFPEDRQERSLRFWREKDSDVETRAAEEEQRQFGQPFPNLAADVEDEVTSAKTKLDKKPDVINQRYEATLVPEHATSGFQGFRRQPHVLIPQLPPRLQVTASSQAGVAEATLIQKLSPTSSPGLTSNTCERQYVAAAPHETDAPEARELPLPWFWLHPIASTDLRVLDVFAPFMQDDDCDMLKQMAHNRQWLSAARVMRVTLSHLLLGGHSSAAQDEKIALDAALALLVFMITAAHSMIPLATGAEGQAQALLLKLVPPPPPTKASAAKIMSDAATVLGMARALLSSHPLDSCKLHAKLQCWLGAVEACHLYHEERSAAAAEALVQALVWESKYRFSGGPAGSTGSLRDDSVNDPVSSETRSSSLFLRCSVTLQLCSVCIRCGDVIQGEQLALQVLDSVSLFEVKKRDEHWSVMGACAELLLARMCAVVDARSMEAQQWVRKAARSADRVAGPGRKSATRKPEAMQVVTHSV